MLEWLRIAADIDRAVTVGCQCDRIIDGHSIRCGKVVGASAARALSHPRADDLQPVCRDCYNWIRRIPENTVEDDYSDAKPWSDVMVGETTQTE